MTRARHVTHLVDDTTAGGVMRVIDYLQKGVTLIPAGTQRLQCIKRGCLFTKRLPSAAIISHLAVSWRALPMLVLLRLLHPATPIIHVEHSYTEAFVVENVRHKQRFAILLWLTYRLFNRIVAVSEAQGEWLLKSGAVRKSRLRVIRSCVDLGAFRAVPRPAFPPRVIGAIGRLDRQKGFDTLIKAFRQIQREGISLRIYGDGPERERLQDLAKNDARIVFMGFEKDPTAALQAVDAVAMPSRWEAYGLVAIETLSAKRRLLVSPVDGLHDHIASGAERVDDTSVEGWQNALKELFASSKPFLPPEPEPPRIFEHTFQHAWQSLIQDVTPKRGHPSPPPQKAVQAFPP